MCEWIPSLWVCPHWSSVLIPWYYAQTTHLGLFCRSCSHNGIRLAMTLLWQYGWEARAEGGVVLPRLHWRPLCPAPCPLSFQSELSSSCLVSLGFLGRRWSPRYLSFQEICIATGFLNVFLMFLSHWPFWKSDQAYRPLLWIIFLKEKYRRHTIQRKISVLKYIYKKLLKSNLW